MAIIHQHQEHRVKIYWLGLISLMLGAMMTQLFFWQLLLGNYHPDIFAKMINLLCQQNLAPMYWNACLHFIASHANFFAPLLAVMMIGCAMLLMLRIMIALAALLGGVLFFAFWLSNLGVPANWSFEYLLPAGFLFCLFFSQLNLWRHQAGWRSKCFGYQLLEGVPVVSLVVVLLVLSVLLAYIYYLSGNGVKASQFVTIYSVTLTMVVCFVGLLFEPYRQLMPSHHNQEPYLNAMVFVIGVMLVFQCYQDYLLKWYTVEGYQHLISSYAQYTHAPGWMKYFLSIAAKHAAILMPIQVVFEVFAAACLSLLIFRFPMLLLTAGFFALLMFAELGVPAAWPPRLGSPGNWAWELLLPTMLLVIAGLSALAAFYQTACWRQRLLGHKMLTAVAWPVKALLVFVCVLIVTLLLLQSVPSDFVVKCFYYMAMTLFILIVVFILLDCFRCCR